MRALRYHRDEDKLKVEDVDKPPQPRGNDVLIRVKTTAFTSGELDWPEKKEKEYHIPGHDVAGIIEAVGETVPGFQPNDEVCALLPFTQNGAASTHTLASANDLAIKPSSLTFEEAASIPLTALTAYQALFTHADAQPGQKVLVLGAYSSVGVMAVQIARLARCLVSAVCSGSEGVRLVRGLGAHEVFDYGATPLSALSHDYDVVIDCVGTDVLPQCFALLKGRGKLVCTAWPARVEEKAQRPDVEAICFVVEPDGEELTRVAQCGEQGYIRPVVGSVVAFEEGAKAFERLRNGHANGKVVVSVDGRADSPRQSMGEL